MGFLHYLVGGGKKLLVKFKYMQKIDVGFFVYAVMFFRGGCISGEWSYLWPPKKEGEFLLLIVIPLMKYNVCFNKVCICSNIYIYIYKILVDTLEDQSR